MTRDEMKTFTTSVLGGEELGDTLFDTLLNSVRSNRENERPWRKLVKEDSSKTATSSNVFTTAHSLPSDFRRALPRRAVVLVSTTDSNDFLEYEEVLFENRFQRQNSSGFFFIDHANNNLHLAGTLDKSYVIHLFYIYNPGDITNSNAWPFPSEFHPILPYDIAAVHKGGIDYDDTNARMAPEDRAAARAIHNAMIKWDTELMLTSLNM